MSANAAGATRPLRVAFYLPRFPVPSETFVMNQIEGLARRGVHVDVVTEQLEPGIDAAAFARELGVRALHAQPPLPYSKVRRLAAAARVFARVARARPAVALRSMNIARWGASAVSLRLLFGAAPFLDGEWDVVLCHFGPAGLQAVRLREVGAFRAPVATVFHGFDLSNTIASRGAGYYRDLFRLGDLFLPVSERWRGLLVDLGCDPARVVVHRMGVPMPASGAPARADVGPIRLLSVARLVEKKGIEYALRALALLGRGVGYRYTVVGDGPDRASLETLARELGVADRVDFVGWRTPDQVAALIAEAHVFVAPSVTAANGDQEGIPVAIMEAMAHALPVVSTLHSGIPELVVDGETGLLAPERGVEELADALRRLIGSPRLRQDMGAAGRRRVEARHDVERLNDALLLLLEGLRSPGGAGRFRLGRLETAGGNA